ncbi:MAG TPA: STAS domain-containing protein [Pyrinomonadaceae bacterium]|nr:STAS domain-containing protein [Pyrinomonadaceae bacterium]
MTTRITQVDGQAGKITALRVEGSLRLPDAELLEATYLELQATQKSPITIDLAGTNFLDSDSASILCRLKRRGVELIGLHYFVQQIIQAAENE